MKQETEAFSERAMGVAALASLSGGFVAGIGARIIMRVVALTAHMPPDFSIAGTLNILVLGIIVGFSCGFVMAIISAAFLTSPRFGKYVPGPVWRGLITGVLLLLVGFPIFVNADADDLALGIPLLNKIMFAGLVLLYGLTLGVAENVFEHILPHKPTSTGTDNALL